MKDYDMSVLYHPSKDNVITDALSRMTICSVSDVVEANKDLFKDVYKLARLDVRLEDSPNGCFIVHSNSESCIVVEVNSKQHLGKPLMELNESAIHKINESFSIRGWCIEVSRKVVYCKCR